MFPLSLRTVRFSYVILVLCMAALAVSIFGQKAPLTAVASVGVLLAYFGIQRFLPDNQWQIPSSVDPVDSTPNVVTTPAPMDDVRRLRADYENREDTKAGAVVEEMIQQGRYALLLRPAVLKNLTESQRQFAAEILEDEMSHITGGEVQMMAVEAIGFGQGELEDEIACTDSIYLDRFAVTNGDYLQFVADGGYSSLEYWSPAIVNAIPQFVDRTGKPGPRYWKDGHCEEGQADHPVIGVSYNEAAAYARWVGKRLPSDEEWVKSAAAPVSVSPTRVQQRKYPWGDAVDEQRANLWLTGMGRTAPVTSFAAGDSVQGVRQLVGNVWEWTSNSFGCWSPWESWRDADTGFLSLRGGAFDTYFESQATCLYQSGDHPLARKHNIGFRCALTAKDVVLELEEPQPVGT